MGRALQPPFLGASVQVAASSRRRRRKPTAQQLLAFEFLAPFYVFAAATTAIASAVVWLQQRNPIMATLSLAFTLLFAIDAVAAFGARARLRKMPRG